MISLRSILAAGCLSSIAMGAPLPSMNQILARSSYVEYGGTGLLSEGWPAQSSWVSFDTMWAANQGTLSTGCGWSADQLPENSPSEISQLKSAIQSVSSSSGVDSRFIFAIVLQESNGCVRVHSTDNGVANPGLMQSHRGAGTCNIGSNKQVPCPQDEIVQMIKDGTLGTAAGDGLVGVLQKSGATDDSKFYKAARIYNSGSIAASRNIGDGNGATACYAADVANRLMGFAGNSGCSAGVVSTLSKTVGFTGSAPVDNTPVPSTPAPSTPGGVFAQTPSTPSQAPAAPAPVAPAPVAPAPAPAAPAPAAPAPVAPAPAPVAPAPAAPVNVQPAPSQETNVIVNVPDDSTVPTPPVAAAPSAVQEPARQTATVIPLPVSPVPATTEHSTPQPPAANPNPAASASGIQTPGSPCAVDGTWNCIGGSTFQQCGSGIWSAVQSVAAGTQCQVGQGMTFTITVV